MLSEKEVRERIELVKKAIKPHVEFITDQATKDLFFFFTKGSERISRFELVQNSFFAGVLVALLWVLEEK